MGCIVGWSIGSSGKEVVVIRRNEVRLVDGGVAVCLKGVMFREAGGAAEHTHIRVGQRDGASVASVAPDEDKTVGEGEAVCAVGIGFLGIECLGQVLWR